MQPSELGARHLALLLVVGTPMRKLLLIVAVGLSCSAPPLELADGWPAEIDDSCWDVDPAQEYLTGFQGRVFGQAALSPGTQFRFVLAMDGTLAQLEVYGNRDRETAARIRAALDEARPVPVPPDAACIANVTLTGVVGVPVETETYLPPLRRSGEPVTLDAVVTQLLDAVHLPDGSQVVRARIQRVPIGEDPDLLTVMCWSPPANRCPSEIGEAGSYVLWMERTEGRLLVERYEREGEPLNAPR